MIYIAESKIPNIKLIFEFKPLYKRFTDASMQSILCAKIFYRKEIWNIPKKDFKYPIQRNGKFLRLNESIDARI